MRQPGDRRNVGSRFAAIATNVILTPKIIRFILVGFVNSVFGYAVFAGLTMIGCPDVAAVPVAMAVGVVFNFLSYGKLVFASLDPRRLPRFLAAYSCLYACNVFGPSGAGKAGAERLAAQAFLVFPLAALAYFLNDRWVFRVT